MSEQEPICKLMHTASSSFKPKMLNNLALFSDALCFIKFIEIVDQDYQDYQDPSVDSTVTDGHRQGKKA